MSCVSHACTHAIFLGCIHLTHASMRHAPYALPVCLLLPRSQMTNQVAEAGGVLVTSFLGKEVDSGCPDIECSTYNDLVLAFYGDPTEVAEEAAAAAAAAGAARRTHSACIMSHRSSVVTAAAGALAESGTAAIGSRSSSPHADTGASSHPTGPSKTAGESKNAVKATTSVFGFYFNVTLRMAATLFMQV